MLLPKLRSLDLSGHALYGGLAPPLDSCYDAVADDDEAWDDASRSAVAERLRERRREERKRLAVELAALKSSKSRRSRNAQTLAQSLTDRPGAVAGAADSVTGGIGAAPVPFEGDRPVSVGGKEWSEDAAAALRRHFPYPTVQSRGAALFAASERRLQRVEPRWSAASARRADSEGEPGGPGGEGNGLPGSWQELIALRRAASQRERPLPAREVAPTTPTKSQSAREARDEAAAKAAAKALYEPRFSVGAATILHVDPKDPLVDFALCDGDDGADDSSSSSEGGIMRTKRPSRHGSSQSQASSTKASGFTADVYGFGNAAPQSGASVGSGSSSHDPGKSLPMPPRASFLPILTVLRLSCNRLTGPLPISLSNLVSLSELRLDGNRLTGPCLPPAIVELRHCLRILDVGSNLLTGTLGPAMEQATLLTELTILGWGGNRLAGSFGNFFGDDDDEGALLFPDPNFDASEKHAALHGRFEDETGVRKATTTKGGVGAKGVGAKGVVTADGHYVTEGNEEEDEEEDEAAEEVDGEGESIDGVEDDEAGDTIGDMARVGSVESGATTAAATGSTGPSKRLLSNQLRARVARRFLLIRRRRWLFNLTAFNIGGNAGIFGTVPPLLVTLRLQGRLLIDLNGCGRGGELWSADDALQDDDEAEAVNDDSEDEDSDSDDEEGGGGGMAAATVARRKALRQAKRKARRAKRRARAAARAAARSEDRPEVRGLLRDHAPCAHAPCAHPPRRCVVIPPVCTAGSGAVEPLVRGVRARHGPQSAAL